MSLIRQLRLIYMNPIRNWNKFIIASPILVQIIFHFFIEADNDLCFFFQITKTENSYRFDSCWSQAQY